MENKIYYTVEIVPKFNRNIVERDKMDALTHKNMVAHFHGLAQAL